MSVVLGFLGTIGGWFGLNPLGMLAKAVGGGLALIALIALLMLAKSSYDSGVVRDERARVEAVRAAAEVAQRANERAAEDVRRQELTRAQAEAQTRRKEIDDATRGLPDAALSDRQRSRACIELRRQATARGDHQPAC